MEEHSAATSAPGAELRGAPAAATTAAAAHDSASTTTQQTDRARRRGATRHHGSRSTTGAPRSVTPTSSGGIAVRAPHESGPASAAPHHTAQGSTTAGGGDPGTGVALPAEITQAVTSATPPLPVTVGVAVPAVIGGQPQAPVAAQAP